MSAPKAPALLVRASEVLAGQLAVRLSVGLYLVSTPIGNLADISLRALGVLARADIIYCEDKRHSVRLLDHYGIKGDLKAYHEHNAVRAGETLLTSISAGKSVALISDAGTPLVSDPGYKLVVEAKKRGFDVVAIPGPSAPIAALVSAGLPTDCFTFVGFLPPKKAARKKRLLQFVQSEATLIFFESPKRLKASIRDFVECFGTRQAAIARELTKLHENVRTGTLAELGDYYEQKESVKGEIVILVAGCDPQSLVLSDEQLERELVQALQAESLRDAVQAVCARFNLPRSKVYNLAVEIKRGLD
ncbi:MAG: 16S rRNA (cytidine(1402)-2'-O)-methyltransferase [Hyphomicrobiaceae bacterium]|nr:16S rRNA (cytidine(1402)-2'-O)-methyltransferase [Hyphomicrobiaceae bacterium]